MVAPSCAGDLEMYTPASSRAANFAVGSGIHGKNRGRGSARDECYRLGAIGWVSSAVPCASLAGESNVPGMVDTPKRHYSSVHAPPSSSRPGDAGHGSGVDPTYSCGIEDTGVDEFRLHVTWRTAHACQLHDTLKSSNRSSPSVSPRLISTRGVERRAHPPDASRHLEDTPGWRRTLRPRNDQRLSCLWANARGSCAVPRVN